ncbi:hypothetical protein BCR32DRAFT_278204 [Anaeromyces robustus]|uniref:Uncharacterized protein n=1 Tax=Anaeromyces robustus TaxID=1754192 RepID=A0A1Y1XBW6_9FUNG|nr:hypothetical protein BCR32DRAFT_278204 [Anaeromyces robustus]|eukprot:ORX83215.1 hypothetical protein BCR32DRAFT_278204 [Anaeromyces robustus]
MQRLNYTYIFLRANKDRCLKIVNNKINVSKCYDNNGNEVFDISITKCSVGSVNQVWSFWDKNLTEVFSAEAKIIENDPNADNFYLFSVNYTLVDNNNENNTDLINEIHDLITDNINTYKHPEDVEEVLDKEKIRKRYDYHDIYYGCGINAGYNKCGDKSCCIYNSYCVKNENSCIIENEYQSNYGF